MEFSPDRDGMAWVSAYLRADQALAINNDLTATARSLQGPNEARTLTQLKADDFARRLLTHRTGNTTGIPTPDPTATGSVRGEGRGDAAEEAIGLATLVGSDEPATEFNTPDAVAKYGDRPDQTEPVSIAAVTDLGGQDPDAGKVPTPRADVLVTVPFFALFGITDEPAELDGYGPIPASMARELLAGGTESFRRVLVDPRDGTPMEIGRTSYRLTKAMKKALQLRDGKCVFPGCTNNALDTEADHLQAWQHGGTTGVTNLAQLCPRHHRLKHNSSWQPTTATKNEPPGWTSPTGRHYQAEQPDREPPQWPSQLGVEQGAEPLAQAPEPGAAAIDAGPAATPCPYPAWLNSASPDSAWPDPAWFESAPPYPEPPCGEPEDEDPIDVNEFEPDDPIWEAFYAKPFILPPDPQPEWMLMVEATAP